MSTHEPREPQRPFDDDAPLDVVVVGGGPAGMSAALIAGRARLRTAVFNTERPRNRVTTAAHGFLTRDGVHPMELLAIAKQQLEPYRTVRYLCDAVIDVRPLGGGGFEVCTAGRVFQTKRLVLATGYRDELERLGIPGIQDAYGSSVYPCPFCDGFENRDRQLAVFGSDGVEHFVPVVRVWSEDIVVFTNGVTLDAAAADALRSRGIGVEEAPIERLRVEDGALRAVELEGDRAVPREAGFLFDDCSVPAVDFADRLGVPRATNAWGMQTHEADASGKTSVEGVYLVGDAKLGFGGLIAAAEAGANCLQSIVHEIATERWNGGGARQRTQQEGSRASHAS